MKIKNLTTWITTMLVSFGAFATAVLAMGTLHVPMQSATPPVSTAPSISAPAPSANPSATPVALTATPAGGRSDDATFTKGSSSPLSPGSDH
jgi:hypothetical protein